MRMHERGEGRGHHGRMGRKIAMMMAMRGRGRDGSRDWGGDWDGDWGGRGGHGGPGRHRRGRMFAGGELRLVLLRLVADESRHGYELIKAIEELTGGAYAPSPGVVYPTLTMLDDMGLTEEQKAEGAKKQFGITAAGQEHLAEHAEEVEALFARLAELGSIRARTSGGPIRRAMHNLRSVLQERLSSEEVDGETLHQVAEILDEAARKIERL